MRLHKGIANERALEGFSGLNTLLSGVFVLLSFLANSQSNQENVQIIEAYEPFQIRCTQLECAVHRDGSRFSSIYDSIKYVDGEIMVWESGQWWYFEVYKDDYKLEDERIYYRVCEIMPCIDACYGLSDSERIFCIENTIKEDLDASGIMRFEDWDDVDVSPYVLKLYIGKNNAIHRVEPFRSMSDQKLENEILQFVMDYEGWSSGTQSGTPVNVRYVLPLKSKKR